MNKNKEKIQTVRNQQTPIQLERYTVFLKELIKQDIRQTIKVLTACQCEKCYCAPVVMDCQCEKCLKEYCEHKNDKVCHIDDPFPIPIGQIHWRKISGE